MKCSNCGSIISDNAAFCPNCGARTGGEPYRAGEERQETAYGADYQQNDYRAQNDTYDNRYAYDNSYENADYEDEDAYAENANKPNKAMVGVLVAMGCIIIVLVIVLLFIIFSNKNKDKLPTTPAANQTTDTLTATLPTTSDAGAYVTEPTVAATTATTVPTPAASAPAVSDPAASASAAAVTTAAPGSISTGAYKVNTKQDDLNIRSGAGADQSIVGRIPKDTVVTVTAVNGNWAYVTYNGVSGWVSATYLIAVTN